VNLEIHIIRYNHYYQETGKHLKRLNYAFKKLKEINLFPLTEERIKHILANEDLVPLIDQISYRYSKLQDTLGKLIRSYLYLKGENVENLPMIDVINLASKFGLGIDKEKWFQLRELRNLLVQEYEDKLTKIANTLNEIYSQLDYIEQLVNKLEIKEI
jgi:hypothetical protein